MSEQPEISRLVTAVFGAWQQSGINFLILRNYEGLPDFAGNDIDVLVHPAQLREAEGVLLAAARNAGFRLHNRVEFATLALYLSSQQGTTQTHFDLFTALKWRGFDLLACEGFLERKASRGLFSVPHPADETAAKLLASMIYTGKVKEKYRQSLVAGFLAEPAATTRLLAETYGQANAEFLVAAGAKADWALIEARTGALRRALILRQLTRRPGRTLKSALRLAGRLAGRLRWPPGLTLVLCGADGSGKSTAARAILDGLSSTFPPQKVRHFHWKPTLFTARRQGMRGPATDPHGQPPRNPAISLCYFALHWLEFFLGSYLRIRPVTFRGGLVLIDRYYYDFFVDQRRYRLAVPRFIIRVGQMFLKQPDLIVLLDAPGAVLQARKQEVSLAETERQRAAYRQMVEGLSNGCIVDATLPPEQVGAEIKRAVLDFMAARTVKRWGAELAGLPGARQPPKAAAQPG